MAWNTNSHKLGIQHADTKLAHVILQRGTHDRFSGLTPEKQQWCTYILQLPHHLGGFGFTSGKASGIAAFYSATARFVQWLGSLPNKENWVRNQDMLDHTSWNAPDLQSLAELHSTMLHTYHCIEASSPSQHNDDAQPANGSQDTHPLSLPSLNSLALTQDSLEDGDADVFIPTLPPQKRITSQILKHWQPHTDARLHASERDKALFKLHNCQRIDAIPSEDAGEAALPFSVLVGVACS